MGSMMQNTGVSLTKLEKRAATKHLFGNGKQGREEVRGGLTRQI